MSPLRALHLVDPQSPGGGPCMLRLLADVIAEPSDEIAIVHDVLVVGTRSDVELARRCGLSPRGAYCPPRHLPLSGRRAWQRLIAAREREVGQFDVLHGWSARAGVIAALVAPHTPRIVSLDVGPDPGQLLRSMRAVMRQRPMPILASSESVSRRYRDQGIGEHRTAVMPPAVRRETIMPDRAALRSRWGVNDDEFLIGALCEPSGCIDAPAAKRIVAALQLTGRRVMMIAPPHMRRHVAAMWWGRHYKLDRALIIEEKAIEPWHIVAGLDAAWLTSGWFARPRQSVSTIPALWAAAAKLPIVAERTEAMSELFIDGESAWLCPPGDVAALCDRFAHLYDHRAEGAELAAKAAAPQHTDIAMYASRLRRLYQRHAGNRVG